MAKQIAGVVWSFIWSRLWVAAVLLIAFLFPMMGLVKADEVIPPLPQAQYWTQVDNGKPAIYVVDSNNNGFILHRADSVWLVFNCTMGVPNYNYSWCNLASETTYTLNYGAKHLWLGWLAEYGEWLTYAVPESNHRPLPTIGQVWTQDNGNLSVVVWNINEEYGTVAEYKQVCDPHLFEKCEWVSAQWSDLCESYGGAECQEGFPTPEMRAVVERLDGCTLAILNGVDRSPYCNARNSMGLTIGEYAQLILDEVGVFKGYFPTVR